ncbi:hypothetical protein PAHAL_6G093300 [Panicum hallii]|uniref:Uncharacterized protein n=1 Tax=Panicum hallii TaxID=206008 RepID=A0A2T8IFS8_9POAL|nr:hypothetical protein PAHAL_6G093300 [Panicum hallii]
MLASGGDNSKTIIWHYQDSQWRMLTVSIYWYLQRTCAMIQRLVARAMNRRPRKRSLWSLRRFILCMVVTRYGPSHGVHVHVMEHSTCWPQVVTTARQLFGTTRIHSGACSRNCPMEEKDLSNHVLGAWTGNNLEQEV